MEKLGNIVGDTIVLDKSDKVSACKLVDALPDPLTCVFSTVVLSQNSGDYKKGDKFIKQNNTWAKLEETFTSDLPIPAPITATRVEGNVSIRWSDPQDTETSAWKHTRILRKYGTPPANEFDGIVVVDSYVRDFYANKQGNALHDYLPEGLYTGWFYKMFVFSSNEVVTTSADAIFSPYEVNWDTLKGYITNGLAPKIFCLGDSIVLGNGEIELEVVAFDQAYLNDLTQHHSVTFVGTVAAPSTVWDAPWGSYHVILENTYVMDTTKKYYRYDKTAGKYVQKFVGLGQLIEGVLDVPTTDPTYEAVTVAQRKTQGGNLWSRSVVRQWLNSTDLTHITDITDTPILARLFALEPSLENLISKVKNVTAKADIDGGEYDITIDRLYLLSKTEVFGLQNQIGTNVSGDPICINENEPMPYFIGDPANRTRLNASGAPTNWWLRSPNFNEIALVHSVDDDGEIINDTDVTVKHGVMFALTIGG